MTIYQIAVLALSLPFAGTALGAALVFFMKTNLAPRLQRALLGFAAGVMTAASVWSLLIPAIETARLSTLPAWIPAVFGFLIGVFCLMLPEAGLSRTLPLPGVPGKTRLLVLAVTLHNLPEGMAVGVALAGLMSDSGMFSAAAVIALAVGIAVQNFPEGTIISVPLAGLGQSKRRAFVTGVLSGAVEPLGALAAALLTALIRPALPFILAFAAGAMIYVVFDELIPDAHADERLPVGTAAAALGFAVMMLLDVALG